jgi:WD40-like Beta Propeller Repeat
VQIPQGYAYRRDWAGRHLDITPDGKKIVYDGQSRTAAPRLYVQAIGATTATELAGTDGATDPSVSPDGRYVVFYANDAIRKAALDGSGVTVIGRAPGVRGIAWIDDDTLILGPIQGNLLRMSVSTGAISPLREFMGPAFAHLHPYVLPENKGVLFTLAEGPLSNARIGVVSLPDGKEHLLLDENAFAPSFLPTGHIVFAHGPHRELMAAQFDLNTLEIIGKPQPALNSEVSGLGTGGSTDYAFSSSGTLIYTCRTTGDSMMCLRRSAGST